MKSSVMTPARIAGACLCGLLLCGPVATHAQETGEPTHAQPELPKVALTITGHDNARHVFSVEKATTPREQQVGEMYRKSVPADGGMIFVWSFPRQSDMWMQHTLVPLDIVFIGTDNRVSSIVENAVPLSLAHISSHGAVRATLELQGGLTEKLGIVVGDKVESAALPEAAKPSP
ncbi:hypothetical protein ATCC53582_00383 [Novacetimonas hansenii]|nr:DUF192 domain-containing protein [Novacetimonas hansenii]WEQ57800.1 DUF192 domain-containing protein [Novacetimonas hansenii]CUW46291.1 hypothetical protein ATCC53582_00383 [Novacetimonas hansenii]